MNKSNDKRLEYPDSELAMLKEDLEILEANAKYYDLEYGRLANSFSIKNAHKYWEIRKKQQNCLDQKEILDKKIEQAKQVIIFKERKDREEKLRENSLQKIRDKLKIPVREKDRHKEAARDKGERER